ncbi:MAG TPA: hypothetical protein VMA37_10245 [Acetobacteraceae bacterium]|nr:hypothetical protein [Acetobacteraceae bacterium]
MTDPPGQRKTTWRRQHTNRESSCAAQPGFARDNLRDADAVLVILCGDHFAFGHDPAVDSDVERIADRTLKADDFPLAERLYIADPHIHSSELDSELDEEALDNRGGYNPDIT